MDEPQSDSEGTTPSPVNLGQLESSGVGHASIEVSSPATLQLEHLSPRTSGLGALSIEATGEVRPVDSGNVTVSPAPARLTIETPAPIVTVTGSPSSNRARPSRWVVPINAPEALLATAARLHAADDIENALTDVLARRHEPTAAAIIDELVAPLMNLVIRALRLDEQTVMWWASHRDDFVVAIDRVGTAQELGRKLKVGGEVLEVLANLATILGVIFEVVRVARA